ncbi:MAG: hypothetical protein AB1938_12345 [Myxococcota bacterium]
MTGTLLLAMAAVPDAALLDRIAERTKAVEAFTSEAQLTVKVVSDELDSDGKSKKHNELVFQVSRKDGKPHRVLVSATEDGKDVSEATREELAEQDEKNGEKKNGSMSQASPFHPEQRAKYAFSTLPSTQAEPQFVRIAFQPAGEKTSALMIGDATVDPQTGDLVRMSMRPSKNPTFVDRLYLELEFEAPTPAGRALSKLTAKGAGGIAFIKKRFAVVTTFSDYRARE